MMHTTLHNRWHYILPPGGQQKQISKAKPLKSSLHHTPLFSNDFLIIPANFLFTSVSLNSNSSRQRKGLSLELIMWILMNFFWFVAIYHFLMIHQNTHRAFELHSERQMTRQYKFRQVAYFGCEVGGASEWWCH